MEDSKKILVFTMDSEIALEFWKRVKEQGLKTEIDRRKLLLEMAKEGLIKSVSETSRTKEQIVADYAKHYKVLDCKDIKDDKL